MFKAGTYTEFLTVFCNVFLGMQPALSSYLQVCFSITNDVVMSISLMYEKPESGEHRYSGSSCHAPDTYWKILCFANLAMPARTV